MAGGELIERSRSLWTDRIRAVQIQLRHRFRVAVDRHRHWRVRPDHSLAVRRWIRKVWGDAFADSANSRASYRFYRKRVGKVVDGVDDSVVVRMVQAVAVPMIGSACHVFMHGLNHVKIYGAEKLHQALLERPQGKPLLTVSNHVAAIDDPFVTASLLPPNIMLDARNLRWTLCATDRCFRNPVLSAFFRCVKVLPVSRGDGIYQKGMDMALSKLNSGGWVHIFPEGSRSRDGGKTISLAKRGVGRLVMDADNIPIVIPFVHTGMQEIMPVGTKLPKVGKQVTVVVGNPIYLEDLLVSKDEMQDGCRGTLYDAVSSRIGHQLQELKVQADRLALEKQFEIQHYHGQGNHGYGIWQQVDWEAFGMENVMLPDGGVSQNVKHEHQNQPNESIKQPSRLNHSHQTIYDGGIVSRVRCYENPAEFMGFAAKGLFMNAQLIDEAGSRIQQAGRRFMNASEEVCSNIQEAGPVKAWRQFVKDRSLDERHFKVQDTGPVKAWKQFFESSVLRLHNSM